MQYVPCLLESQRALTLQICNKLIKGQELYFAKINTILRFLLGKVKWRSQAFPNILVTNTVDE